MLADLVALLRADSALAALVAARAVNLDEHPQGVALPGVVITLISGAVGLTMKGPDGLMVARVQVDCYDPSAARADAVAAAVIAALHGRRVGQFSLIEHLSSRSTREGGTNAADRPFRRSMDFNVNWKESD